MSNIPEITEQQYRYLVQTFTHVAAHNQGLGIFIPNSTDGLEKYQFRQSQLKDFDHLVELGLMQNVTDDSQDFLKLVKEKYNRDAKVYSVTLMGVTLLSASSNKWIN